MPTYTLLGTPGSPFVRKVLVALVEKGIAFNYEFVNLFPLPKDFGDINPLRTLPVLRLADGTHIGDSTAICTFLDRMHPEVPLYPADPADCAQAMMWEEYGDSLLAVHLSLRVFRPLVTSMFTGKPPDVERVRATVDKQFPRLFSALSRQLGDREFLVGDQLTIADISVATHFANLHFAGLNVDTQAFGELHAYIHRMLSRPSFADSIERESKVMPPPSKI